ncbi:MAG: energy-coupling factor transporter transmembrane component T family protein [Desulfatibacillaceae bacterium]
MIGGFSSDGDTPVHRLHPFSKMLVGAGFTVFSLLLMNPVALGLLLAFLLVAAVLARVRISGRRVFGLLVFFTVFGAVNFWASDDPSHAVAYCLRLGVFMAAIPTTAATTAPQDMARALTRLRLPGGVVVSLLLVWRFFPVLAAEAREMRQAAVLRGEAGGVGVARMYRGFLVPLAFSVVEYADRISLALEVRGFCPDARRTCHAMPRFGKGDLMYGAAAVLVCVLAGVLQWGGLG